MDKQQHQSQNGEIAVFPTDLELCSVLECPICSEIPTPPIYNCAKGHSICNVCRPKLEHCQLCKSVFTDSRNFGLESIIMMCKFYCHFKEYGCEAKVSGELLKQHLANCKFRNGPVTDTDKEMPNIKPTIPGCLYWVPMDCTEPVPDDAVSGGIEDGTRFYVVRKLLPCKALVPGKFNYSNKQAMFSWENKIYSSKKFEILTSHPDSLDWVSLQADDIIPTHAVIAGKSDIGEVLYIGRKGHRGKLCVGFVNGNSKQCTILADQIVVNSSLPFEILTKNEKGILLENSFNY